MNTCVSLKWRTSRSLLAVASLVTFTAVVIGSVLARAYSRGGLGIRHELLTVLVRMWFGSAIFWLAAVTISLLSRIGKDPFGRRAFILVALLAVFMGIVAALLLGDLATSAWE